MTLYAHADIVQNQFAKKKITRVGESQVVRDQSPILEVAHISLK